ncbi:MAG: hypothetical protein KZQ64_07270 [gamma proteobacterium symbiont of Bathyaustriella thionipta]|nr:hypothetical protein [gamma proteobacterium symbiont of Bathyaustriella thionipta]MCU7951352.1 hypothetical protein [gamma proteobacterium symbiont of Bathyaustriella thionipta]MCU7953172.1 hypothetical protein [gamma proteobacterium symbiont of Bathyaustriella thionipta]MCU7957906.1 hypothetical protein [gamma proteobacterium symbiont of Bathyaustriella thionipta]MCU7965963.1 hypothetical protein [gamma proteobacterium symbiont of Bathyaustriella thionipta]
MKYTVLILSVLVITISGCAGNPNSSLANQCDTGLNMAYKELDYAKSNGFDGTVEYTKAASLLGAAKIQSEFGKYPNCIDKVNRARAYIKKSQQ